MTREAAHSPSSLLPQWTTGLLLPAVVALAWEVGAHAGWIPPNWLPAPSIVATKLVELTTKGELVEHVTASLLRLFAGFGLGAVTGTALGVITGRSARARALLDPTIQALRSVPSLAWVPLFLLWLGIQEASKIALIAVGAFFPVYLHLMTGILAIDSRLVEVGLLHGYRGFALARWVLLPATLPAYISGLRGGAGLAWMFVVAAELMGANRGLGFLLLDGQTTSRPELVIGAIALFAVLGKLTDKALALLGHLQGGARSRAV